MGLPRSLKRPNYYFGVGVGVTVAAALGASFLFAPGSGDVCASGGVADWARTEALKQSPPQAIAMTAQSEISFSWVVMGLFS
jgi:hypothetical protein